MAYDLVVREDDNNVKYISLAEGAEYSGYSQDYLRFRIRQGKLRAKKIGRNWLTSHEWIDEYLQKVSDYKKKVKEIRMAKEKALLLADEDKKEEEDPVAGTPMPGEEVKGPAIDEEQAQFLAPVFNTEPEKEEPLAAFAGSLPAYNIQQNPKPSAVDDKLHLFINPKPMAVFQEECEELPQANPGLLRYAFVIVFLCGVLGFVIGFNYSSFKFAMADIGNFGVKQGEEMLKTMISPLFSEQFTASFGVIFKQSNFFLREETVNNAQVIKKAGGNDNAGLPPSPDGLRGSDFNAGQ